MENGKGDLKEANNLLAQLIARECLVPPQVLQNSLGEANARGIHLGQALVQKQHLSTADLVRLVRKSSEFPSCRGEAETKNPDGAAESGLTRADAETQRLNVVSADSSAADAGPDNRVESASGPAGKMPGSGHFGEYEIISEIARGGMGIVYRARQRGVDRIVALKILLSGPLSGTQAIRRFFREARVIAELDHPHIIPLYAMGEEEGHHYFTMKLVEGGTFADVLDSDVPLQRKVDVIAMICQALHHAHRHKILHRDLKPSNILIDKDGTPYLTDFGLAKVVDSHSVLTQTGSVLGTPYYMSPEQTRGIKHAIDHRSDIYSMGVILYQAITGKLPFTAETLPEIYRRINEEEPKAPEKLNPESPKELNAICRMAMEKSPQFRYPDALSMAEDLERFREGQKVHASRVRIKAGFARFYRHHWQQLVGAVSIVALVLLALALIYRRSEVDTDAAARALITVNDALAEAEHLFAQGSSARAIQLLAETAGKVDHYRLYLAMGRFHLQMERMQEAEKAFDKAFSMEPADPEVLYHSGVFYQAQGENEKAWARLNAYLGMRPEAFEGYRRRAALLQSLGEWGKAARDIERATALEQKFLEEELHEALAEAGRGMEDQALGRLSDILSRYPTYERGYVERANLYHRKRKLREALNDISQAIELNPRGDYHTMRGRWLREAGSTREAYKYLADAISHQDATSQREMSLLLAESAIELGDFPNALAHCRDVFGDRGPEGEWLVKMGHACLETGDVAAATTLLEKARKDAAIAEAMRGEASYHLGRICRQNGDEDRARALWQEAIELKAAHPERVHLLLGQSYLAIGEYASALPHLENAARGFPDDAQIEEDLGNCHVRLALQQGQNDSGHWQAAVLALSRCISLEPWQPQPYSQRATAYRGLKEYGKAGNDLLLCYRLRPDDLATLVELFKNMFEENIAANHSKIRLFLHNYQHAATRASTPDLFREEWEKVCAQCTQQALLFRHNQPQTWNAGEAELLLKSLVTSDSPAVHEMAAHGLMSMYREPALQELVAAEAEKGHKDSTRRRLNQLRERLAQEYLRESKVHVRHLLVRIYRAMDKNAIENLYDLGPVRYECLEALLVDGNENSMIRFLAARASMDLTTRAGYDIVKKNAAEGPPVARLFCNAVLRECRREVPSIASFREAVAMDDRYARATAALHVPMNEKAILHKLLRDSDSYVRLIAASRLRHLGDPEAEAELTRGFLADNPSLVRAYSFFVYWDLGKETLPEMKYRELLKKSEPHLPLLIAATRDRDATVRRVAVNRLADISHKQYSTIIAERLKDEDPIVRFNAIRALARKMETQLVMPIILDHDESIPFRMAVLDGLSEAKEHGKKPEATPEFVIGLLPLLEAPDPMTRMVIFIAVGRNRKSGVAQFMETYARQHQNDPAVLCGYIMNSLSDIKGYSVSYIESLLGHQDPTVRTLAATSVIYVAAKQGHRDLPRLHRRLRESALELRRAGALGYKRLVEDAAGRNLHLDPGQMPFVDLEELYRHSIDSMVNRVRKSPALYDRCMGALSSAIELDPDNARLYFERGVVSYAGERYEESIRDLEKAVELDGAYSFYRYWLARLYCLTDRGELAIAAMDHIPHIVRLDPELSRSRGQILRTLGRPGEADFWLDHASFLEGK